MQSLSHCAPTYEVNVGFMRRGRVVQTPPPPVLPPLVLEPEQKILVYVLTDFSSKSNHWEVHWDVAV